MQDGIWLVVEGKGGGDVFTEFLFFIFYPLMNELTRILFTFSSFLFSLVLADQ